MAYEKEHRYKKAIPFFPDFVLKDSVAIMAYLALFFAIVFFCPDLLTEESSRVPADPYTTPAHIKPEWYFLAAYQELKIFPSETLGFAIQIVVVTALALLPFIDRSKGEGIRQRPVATLVFLLLLLLFIALSVWGKYS